MGGGTLNARQKIVNVLCGGNFMKRKSILKKLFLPRKLKRMAAKRNYVTDVEQFINYFSFQTNSLSIGDFLKLFHNNSISYVGSYPYFEFGKYLNCLVTDQMEQNSLTK